MTLPSLGRGERDPLWRREMRERWRRPITLFFLTLYVVGLCWFGYTVYISLVPPGEVQLGAQANGIGHRLFITLLGVQIAAWIPIALLLTAPTLAAERERRSFTDYVLAGLLPQQIARAKFASVATFIVVLCTVPLPVLALCFPLGGVEPMELVAGGCLEVAVALTSAAIGLAISANNRRVTTAMQHSAVMSGLFLFFGALFLINILNAPFWLWLSIVAFLMFVMCMALSICIEDLKRLSRNLEQDEMPFEGPLAPESQFGAPLLPTQTIITEETGERAATFPQKAEARDTDKPQSFDLEIEKVASGNAVMLREVRVGMRASRLRMALDPNAPSLQLPIKFWIVLGGMGALLTLLPGFAIWWYMLVLLVAGGALVSTVTGASASFTREREQKTLTQLQLCSLAPFDVVSGKVGAVLLLVLRSWGGALLALLVMGMSQGPLYCTLSFVVLALCVVWSSCVATMLSLLCRHTSIVVGGTLAVLATVLFVLPALEGIIIYLLPFTGPLLKGVLEPLWIVPMQTVLGALVRPDGAAQLNVALIEVGCSFAVQTLALLGLCTWVFKKLSLEKDENARRFWSRDLARVWR